MAKWQVNDTLPDDGTWRERSRFWSDAFAAKEKDLRAAGYGYDLTELNRKCAEYADVMARERFGSDAG